MKEDRVFKSSKKSSCHCKNTVPDSLMIVISAAISKSGQIEIDRARGVLDADTACVQLFEIIDEITLAACRK
jgi:hypothetical protein